MGSEQQIEQLLGPVSKAAVEEAAIQLWLDECAHAMMAVMRVDNGTGICDQVPEFTLRFVG